MINIKKDKMIKDILRENGNLTENQIKQEAEIISQECGENVEDICAEIFDKLEERKQKILKDLNTKNTQI